VALLCGVIDASSVLGLCYIQINILGVVRGTCEYEFVTCSKIETQVFIRSEVN
jgi:hypothetical protein